MKAHVPARQGAGPVRLGTTFALVLALWTSGAGGLRAAGSERETFSVLQACLSHAEAENAGLQAVRRSWEAARAAVWRARALPDPSLQFGVFAREVETRVGPQHWRIGLAQKLPGAGKLSAKGGAALQEARSLGEEYRAARFELRHEVRLAYYEYFFLARSIEIGGEAVALARNLEAVALAAYKSGKADYANVLSAQVELHELLDHLQTLEDSRVDMSARLEALLDLSPGKPLPWPEDLKAAESLPSFRELEASLDGSSPKIRSLDSEIRRSDFELLFAERAHRPDLTLGLQYLATGDAAMAGVVDSGKDPVLFTVAFDLPLRESTHRAQRNEARARKLALGARRQQLGHDLRARLQTALFRHRDAQRRVELFRDSLVPKAEQALDVSQQAFMAGRVDFLNLVRAERKILGFKLAQQRARVDREIARSTLLTLVGWEEGEPRKPEPPMKPGGR